MSSKEYPVGCRAHPDEDEIRQNVLPNVSVDLNDRSGGGKLTPTKMAKYLAIWRRQVCRRQQYVK